MPKRLETTVRDDKSLPTGQKSPRLPAVPTITVSDETAQPSDVPGKNMTTKMGSKPLTYSVEQSGQSGQPLKDVDLVTLVQEFAQDGGENGGEGKGEIIKDDSVSNLVIDHELMLRS